MPAVAGSAANPVVPGSNQSATATQVAKARRTRLSSTRWQGCRNSTCSTTTVSIPTRRVNSTTPTPGDELADAEHVFTVGFDAIHEVGAETGLRRKLPEWGRFLADFGRYKHALLLLRAIDVWRAIGSEHLVLAVRVIIVRAMLPPTMPIDLCVPRRERRRRSVVSFGALYAFGEMSCTSASLATRRNAASDMPPTTMGICRAGREVLLGQEVHHQLIEVVGAFQWQHV